MIQDNTSKNTMSQIETEHWGTFLGLLHNILKALEITKAVKAQGWPVACAAYVHITYKHLLASTNNRQIESVVPVGVSNNFTEFDSSVYHGGEVVEEVHGEERILQQKHTVIIALHIGSIHTHHTHAVVPHTS